MQSEELLLDEVNKFYKNEADKNLNFNTIENGGDVEFLEGSYDSVVKTIEDLLGEGDKYNDILLRPRLPY